MTRHISHAMYLLFGIILCSFGGEKSGIMMGPDAKAKVLIGLIYIYIYIALCLAQNLPLTVEDIGNHAMLTCPTYLPLLKSKAYFSKYTISDTVYKLNVSR